MNMNIDRAIDTLKRHGKACLNLADRLMPGGKELNEKEKQLMRISFFHEVQEHCIFIQHAFLMNEETALKESQEQIEKIFNFLNVR